MKKTKEEIKMLSRNEKKNHCKSECARRFILVLGFLNMLYFSCDLVLASIDVPRRPNMCPNIEVGPVTVCQAQELCYSGALNLWLPPQEKTGYCELEGFEPRMVTTLEEATQAAQNIAHFEAYFNTFCPNPPPPSTIQCIGNGVGNQRVTTEEDCAHASITRFCEEDDEPVAEE